MTDKIIKRIVRSRQARHAFRAPYGHIAELCRQAELTEKMLLELDMIAAELYAELQRARHVHSTGLHDYVIKRYEDFFK